MKQVVVADDHDIDHIKFFSNHFFHISPISLPRVNQLIASCHEFYVCVIHLYIAGDWNIPLLIYSNNHVT